MSTIGYTNSVKIQDNNISSTAPVKPLNLDIDVKNLDTKNDYFKTSDSFKPSSNSYSLSKGMAATAKIGLGLAAGDVITRQVYPGQKDKRLHSLVGGLISGVAGEATYALTDNRLLGTLVGIGAGVVAGALKEYRDTKGYGTPDRHDFYATALGSATVGFSLTIKF